MFLGYSYGKSFEMLKVWLREIALSPTGEEALLQYPMEYHRRIPPINALAEMFFTLMGLQFLLFAMWFDMEANKHLK